MAKSKQYSEKDRYNYHNHRYMSGGKDKLSLSNPKRIYSMGFCDAFYQIDNSSAITREDGRKAGFAYRMGAKRGRKASVDYTKKTGKQSRFIHLEKD